MTEPDTPLTVFREYEPHELGSDGYPRVWHNLSDAVTAHTDLMNDADMVLPGGVKDVVRAQAGHRCIRCMHPYTQGRFTWDATNRPSAALDAVAFDGLAEDPDMRSPRKNHRDVHWSPCDERCQHGAPVRVERHRDPRVIGSENEWAYSWPAQARDALRVDPEHNAGRLVNSVTRVEAAWRILTVHHLNGRKHDLRWFNLVSLCQRCHLYVQKTVIMERVYPFEHSAWFKPYAAGWYAYAYLGELLTREEAVARQDELLALERMA